LENEEKNIRSATIAHFEGNVATSSGTYETFMQSPSILMKPRPQSESEEYKDIYIVRPEDILFKY
jgi:hypothetical protein